MSISVKKGRASVTVALHEPGNSTPTSVHVGSYASMERAEHAQGLAVAHLNRAGLRRSNPVRDSRTYTIPKVGDTVPAGNACGFNTTFVAKLRDASGPAYDYSKPFVQPAPLAELPSRPRFATLELKMRQLSAEISELTRRVYQLESDLNSAPPAYPDPPVFPPPRPNGLPARPEVLCAVGGVAP